MAAYFLIGFIIGLATGAILMAVYLDDKGGRP